MILILFLLLSLIKGLAYYRRSYLLGGWGAWGYALTLGLAFTLARLLSPSLLGPLELFLPLPGHDLDTTYAFYPRELIPNLDTAFFRLAAFCFVFVFTLFLLRRLIRPLLVHATSQKRAQPTKCQLSLVGIYALLDSYFLIFFSLQLLTFIGLPQVQSFLGDDFLASRLLFQSPLLSQWIFAFIFDGLALNL
ncbi:hypothetical protein ACWOE5_02465 [Aerococcus sanguinicola]|uniref:CvpA family protein n=1 Tax=Aerococcus sanguinicola TaxID=119206 RepID=A0A0X8FC71_9LACT|nr:MULTISPECIES: hypothetical protein [Aerococcus]AMB94653.1 hypothetical protein AWM72_07745 [Aerococcus sanguinicola]MDK7050863.1 hypothetical protein [Aerococcus sanguinicola]OFT96620.1 hypothetical protein HMPREF3090_02075 [Aerococcus sp. HMSC23C02]PKZ23349.1 hypothetical protein CYJ28_02005 [Aerococcus sanguinicola]